MAFCCLKSAACGTFEPKYQIKGFVLTVMNGLDCVLLATVCKCTPVVNKEAASQSVCSAKRWIVFSFFTQPLFTSFIIVHFSLTFQSCIEFTLALAGRKLK